MIVGRTLLLLTGAALLGGCGRGAEDPGGRTPYEELAVAADTAEGFGTEAGTPVVGVQGGATVGGPLTATGNLQGTRPDSPPGSVTVSEEGGQTRLLVTVQRYTVGTELQASIDAGRCGARGQPLHVVAEPIRIPAEGIATLDVVIPLQTQRILDGRHSVSLTTPRGQGTADVVLACADLPSVLAGG